MKKTLKNMTQHQFNFPFLFFKELDITGTDISKERLLPHMTLLLTSKEKKKLDFCVHKIVSS